MEWPARLPSEGGGGVSVFFTIQCMFYFLAYI